MEHVRLLSNLLLSRCPYCSIANPNLEKIHQAETSDTSGLVGRKWRFYVCKSCGGVVIGASVSADPRRIAREIYPEQYMVDESIPAKPKAFLKEALETLHAPSASIMVSASSVDAMLKEKGYMDGSLYARIKLANENGLITSEMETWADEIRLDANDERHADEDADLPTPEKAKKCAAFAQAFAEYLFVLPDRIERGRQPSPENQPGA